LQYTFVALGKEGFNLSKGCLAGFAKGVLVLRKRIFAVVMAVVVAVGCVGYRPQKAYAGEMLAVGASEVLYALFLSMGVIVSANASHEEKMEATQEIYDALPPKGKAAVLGIMGASEVADGLYSWSSGFNRSDLVALWESAVGVYENDYHDFSVGFGDYSPWPTLKLDGSTNVLMGSVGTIADSPHVIVSSNTSSHVWWMSNNVCYSFDLSSTGVVSGFRTESFKSSYAVNYDLKQNGKWTLGDFYWYWYVNGKGQFLSGNGKSSTGSYYGVAWGSDLGNYIYGSIDPYAFVAVNTVINGYLLDTSSLVDCDTWADSMGRVGEANKEVGIYTGKDLSGYNTLEDAYNGLITGVENPALNPEIPVTPDLTGIAGVLSKILSMLKAIPRTVVGEGSLDFSAFNDIKLSGLFPFCIPFDLINSFKVFNVPPKEPVWTVEFSKTPMVGMPDMVIDMREYNWLFSIGRFFIYISFVIGLIMITRNIIKG